MEGAANSNAGLMRRIVQLEREKNDLQQDLESLCMQQSGISGSMDVVSRTQARRAAGFEQELEACKQNLAFQTNENLNLQEELTETYRVKGKVADAFKAAMDKNKELEKEVKFYQSRMAGAFNERDKAILEVGRLQATEKTTTKELRELRQRLEQIKEQCCEQEQSYVELQQSMEFPVLELKRVQKVVEKFWRLRESAKENGDFQDDIVDKIEVLLEDNDANWVYGLVSEENLEESCRTADRELAQVKEELTLSKAAGTRLEEELSLTQSTSRKLEGQLALLNSASTKLKEELSLAKSVPVMLEEELELTKATSVDLQLQLEGECIARKDAEEKTSSILDQMAVKKYAIERELQQLRANQTTLRTMVLAYIDAEKKQFSLIGESLHVLDDMKSNTLQQEPNASLEETDGSVVQNIQHEKKVLRVHFEGEEPNQGSCNSMEENDTGQHNIANITEDDSRQILAQALQEKVEALLLLSQQEERYYLEASTQSALESQVTLLNQKLAQVQNDRLLQLFSSRNAREEQDPVTYVKVTGEKVKALMELAEERQQIQQLRDQERELTQWLVEQKIAYPRGELQHASHSETSLPSLPGGSSISQAVEDKPVTTTKQRFAASGGYLKGWLRGLDISVFKATSSVIATSSSKFTDMTVNNKSDIGNSVARLLVENATLQERISSMLQLAKSAHRLRMILAKVSMEAKEELAPSSIQSAIAVVDSVKSEAKQLTTAVGCALPLSYQGPLERSPESSYVESSSEEILEGGSEETEGAPHDSVALAGIEIAELLLALAELQIDSLLAMLKMASTDE